MATNDFEFGEKSIHNVIQSPFAAVTIQPDESGFTEPLIPRPHLLDLIDRPPISGPLVSISAPFGAGKTVLALQWVRQHRRAVQYIAARPMHVVPEGWLHEPDELGRSLAGLLNACSRAVPDHESVQVLELVQRVVAASEQSGRSLILDDLDLLPQEALETLASVLESAIQPIRNRRVFMVGRFLDTTTLSDFKALLAGVRLILPETLALSATEASLGQNLGVFGDTPLTRVMEVREESGGWIAGMEFAIATSDDRIREFREQVLHELLLDVSIPARHAMIAAAFVPWFTHELWTKWFEHLNLPLESLDSVLSRIPTRRTQSQLSQTEIVPVIRETLMHLSTSAARWSVVEELLVIAMRWFANKGEPGIAMAIAGGHHLETQFLQAIKPVCKKLASEENWPRIIRKIEGIPDEVLIMDPDITFWAFHGYVEIGQPQHMNRLWSLVEPIWVASDDPLLRGRAHLVHSFGHFMRNQAELALRSSTLAYKTLPEDSHHERLWASGMAAISCGYLGDSRSSNHWAAKSLIHFPYLPTSMRWWHNAVGPIRISQIAASGMMAEAHELALQQVSALEIPHPTDTTRYLVVLAEIATERGMFEEAEMWITRARKVMVPTYGQLHFVRKAEAALARAKGDLETAWDLISAEISGPTPRHDLGNRATALAALIALERNDLPMARTLLESFVELDDTWPKYFGDPHPDLLRALLLAIDGQYVEATALATLTVDQSPKRGQTYNVVAGYSMLSLVYHMGGQYERSSEAAEAAKSAGERAGYSLVFQILNQDIRELTDEIRVTTIGWIDSGNAVRAPEPQLTSREREVLQLIASAQSNKQIAEELFISLSTVKNHLASIYSKLGANNRRNAARVARELNLLDP